MLRIALESCESYFRVVNDIVQNVDCTDDVIILGDFNLPGINWIPDSENNLIMNPYHVTSDRAQLVIQSFGELGLHQISNTMNNFGKCT